MTRKTKTPRVSATQRIETQRQRIAELEAMNRQLHARNNELSDDLREARKRGDGLVSAHAALSEELASVSRRLGRLEGYRERVERVDALDRGEAPPQPEADVEILPRPDGAAEYMARMRR